VMGRRPRLAACPGGTDAGFFTRFARVPSIAALGPGLLSVAHGPNEYVPLEDLNKARSLYVSIANRYLHA
jgi:succinyl-diaminopimelate desuccinylase